MNIKIVKTGYLEENCYIVSKVNLGIIIDPGEDADLIIDACGDLKIVEVLITHHHFDHVGALKEVLDKYGLEENKKSGYFNYEVIKTPGHTSDSVTYYFKDDKVMFTGDFLFKGTIGRCDLPTGSYEDMNSSLEKIFKYPLDTKCYPGHGESTTLGDEKKNY